MSGGVLLTASTMEGDNVNGPISTPLSAAAGGAADAVTPRALANEQKLPLPLAPADSEPETMQRADETAERAERDRKPSPKRNRIQFGTLDSIVRPFTSLPSDVISNGIHSTLRDAHKASSAADERSSGAVLSAATAVSQREEGPSGTRAQISHDSDRAAPANSNGNDKTLAANGHSPFAAVAASAAEPREASTVSMAMPTSVFAMGANGVCGAVPVPDADASVLSAAKVCAVLLLQQLHFYLKWSMISLPFLPC